MLPYKLSIILGQKNSFFSEILHCEVSEVSEVLWMGHFRYSNTLDTWGLKCLKCRGRYT